MPRPLLSSAIKKFQEAGRKFRPAATPTATPTRPPTPTRSPGPTASRAARTPGATPSRPAPAPTLAQLSAAFTPKFVLPEASLKERAKQGISATAKAAQTIASERGISFQEAAGVLRDVGGQIKKAKTLRKQILKARPGLSEGEQIRFLRGGGLSSLARRGAGDAFVSREVAGFVVLGGVPERKKR